MSAPGSTPVFYDPSAQRWLRAKGVAWVLLAAVSLAFTVLAASAVVNPLLPSLGLAPVRGLPHLRHLAPPRVVAPIRRDRKLTRAKRRLEQYRAKTPTAASRPATPTHPSEVIGFLVNGDEASRQSLEANVGQLDKLIPTWLHLIAHDGTPTVDDDASPDAVLTWLRARRPELPVVALVDNYDDAHEEWNTTAVARVLRDAPARGRAIDGLLQFVQAHQLQGVCLDLEGLPAAEQPHLIRFTQELTARFRPLGLEVGNAVPLDDPVVDYRSLAAASDYLVLMAYDEHDDASPAGPIASLPWLRSALQRRFAELDPSDTVVALGSYGYDWADGTPDGADVTFQEAVQLAARAATPIKFDPTALNPHFDYADERGARHQVWFLDAPAAFDQLTEVYRHAPRGVALWRLGSEDPSLWPVLARRGTLDRAIAEGLRTTRFDYGLVYEGRGEVLRVTATPNDGTRAITYADGLIVASSYTTYPSPYIITRWGGDDRKRIALTFDDGPDPEFTPQILRILAERDVKATFFVIGLNADLNSGLLRQIADAGHEIGNHTFTHPNIAAISHEQLALELNATERLFESELGRRSVLFRPPYAEDVEPETPDQVAPLLLISERGYYTIGMQIDPLDWSRPGTDAIVQAVIAGATAGAGNVVLLHDGGGDRSQTVAALPRIIDGLRAQGFALVTTSELLGLGRDAVMPPIPRSERLRAWGSSIGFTLISLANAGVHGVFLGGIALGVLRLLFVGTLAIADWWRRRRTPVPAGTPVTVSVLVPAYNEEKVVCETVRSLLASDYPALEIVVIDDGSTDQTAARLHAAFGDEPRVRVSTKPNGGKSAALNFGIAHTRADVIVMLDADTVFRPDTIRNLARHFGDPRVGAVAGNAKVGNRLNLLTRWQALEYITSQNLDRRAFALLNCITVVPGAVGAWRRTLVEAAGGLATDTLAEDADLTFAILRLGYRVVYDPQALAFTEAPDTIAGFVKQRFRWMFGTLQVVWKHVRRGGLSTTGTLGLVAIPNAVIFQVLFPLVSPIADAFMVTSLATTAWARWQHPLDYSTDALQRVVFYYALFVVVDLIAAALAFALEGREQWSLLVWVALQRFCYRQLMYWVAIKATLTAVRGTIVGWGALERKATVSATP